MTYIKEQISAIANRFARSEPQTSKRFLEKLQEDSITRDEGNMSHFCAYFLPFNPKLNQVFIVHHKKSSLWLAPGGHMDKGELLLETLNREIKEELGIVNFFATLPEPFFISITPINNPVQPCTEHLDIWFLLNTDGSNFNVDQQEFHATKWMNLDSAKEIVTDPANLKALARLTANK